MKLPIPDHHGTAAERKIFEEPDDFDILDRGCTCHSGLGHSPCSFCTDAFECEEEYEIYKAEGPEGVREYRSGERAERLEREETQRATEIVQTAEMLSSVKYGRF